MIIQNIIDALAYDTHTRRYRQEQTGDVSAIGVELDTIATATEEARAALFGDPQLWTLRNQMRELEKRMDERERELAHELLERHATTAAGAVIAQVLEVLV